MTILSYDRIRNLDELEVLARKLLEQGKPVGFDIETGYGGLSRPRGSLDIAWSEQLICGFSITNDKSWARYVPVAHDVPAPNLPEFEAWTIIKPVLETLPVYCHNSKYEKRNLRTLEWKGRGPAIEMLVGGDTMLQEFVLSELKGFGLKDLVERHFNHKMAHLKELYPGWTAKQLAGLRFNILELTPEVVNYACEDAAWCLALRERNEARAQTQRKAMYRIEHEVMEILCDMEDWGMHIEWEEMEEERRKAHPFLAKMEKATKAGLIEMVGHELPSLNLNSPKQLQALLYRDLGLTTTRMTKSGQEKKNADKESWEKMSTDKEAMKSLGDQHPPIRKLLELREVENHINRFAKWLDENHSSADGRAHANFSQTTVTTGRFAAADPPVHQMPKEWRFSTVLGKSVWSDWDEIVANGEPYQDYWSGNFRDYLTASPECYLLGYDYSQIELRVLAGMSREPLLLDAFAKGIDVHSVTAAMMLDKSVESVDKKLDRPIGKTMNFALLYQMGWQSLSERLGVSAERAKQLYNNYFAQFSSITTWMQKAREMGMEQGAAETYFGRRVYVPELESHIPSIKAKGERVLINAPIQGSAADYMKIAMMRAKQALVRVNYWKSKVMIIHNLHDALVFEVSNEVNPAELRELLSPAVVFPVKGWPEVVADWEMGQRHGSMTAWLDEPVEFSHGEWRVVDGRPVEDDELPEELHLEEHLSVQLPAVPVPEPGPLHDHPEVVITMPRMPDAAEVAKFQDFLVRSPGRNVVVLRTPEGDVTCRATSSMGVKDSGTISLIFTGAAVQVSAGSVDLEALAGEMR